jgi:hypothetical protein
MVRATDRRVCSGSSAFATSMAPRVSAPSSSRVTVGGSSTSSRPALFALSSADTISAKANFSSSSVKRARPSTAGASTITICRSSGCSALSRNASKPRLSSSISSGAPIAACTDAAISSVWACSKTASNSLVLFGKWWYSAPVVTRASRARSSTEVAA